MRALSRKKTFNFPVSTLVGSPFSNFKKLIKGRDISGYKQRYFFTKWIVWILEWFRLVEERKYGKLIENKKIEKPPIFILGFWRSGTTILHNLMCENPDFGFVNTFQAVFPNHCLLHQTWLRAIAKKLLPEKRPGDNVKFDFKFPQEEEIALGNLQMLSFYYFFYFPQDTEEFIKKSLQFEGISKEEYETWKEAYRSLIKTALINTKGKQFISKNPPNTMRIKQLLEMFPDAKFIYIHRNTYETLFSFLRFTAAVREGIKHQNYNKQEQDLILVRLYKKMLEQYEADKILIPKGQLVEVEFEYFENHMLEEVERIYSELNLSNYEESSVLMKKYLHDIGDYKRAEHHFPEEFINMVDKELGVLVQK
jgi:hypothetical protein